MLNQSQLLSFAQRISAKSTKTKTLGRTIHVALYGTDAVFIGTVDGRNVAFNPLSLRVVFDRRISESNTHGAEITTAKLYLSTRHVVDFVGSKIQIQGSGFEISGRVCHATGDKWLKTLTETNHLSIALTSITANFVESVKNVKRTKL